jgi:hypothetical protein
MIRQLPALGNPRQPLFRLLAGTEEERERNRREKNAARDRPFAHHDSPPGMVHISILLSYLNHSTLICNRNILKNGRASERFDFTLRFRYKPSKLPFTHDGSHHEDQIKGHDHGREIEV